MKTFNYKYVGSKGLEEFIKMHKIAENKSTLIQVFTGLCEVAFIESLVSDIKHNLPQAKIIGSTTSGEIIDATVYEHSTIISFTLFEKTHLSTYFQELTNDSYESAKSLIAQFDKSKKAKVAISFSDGLHTNGEAYLDAFSDYDKELIVAGGLAGDNATFTQTIVFTEKEILTKGCVVALLYNDDLIVNTVANFGWENIGKVLTITKAEDNVVYEISGMKAVDIYTKYLGKDISEELPRTGIEFPMIVKRDGLDIPRAVLGKNSDGSLVFAGSLKVGEKVTFGYGNVEAIVDGGNKSFEKVIEKPTESIFIYSCMARIALMGSSIALELKALKLISSLSGFFTYGEFYTDRESLRNELLNQTMTILCLSESKVNNNNTGQFCEFKDRRGVNKTLKALSHLISQTTKELEAVNNSLVDKVKEEVQKNRDKDQKLQQQSRLAQMGEMLSMIAHQWRQPLAAISSTSAGLELKAELDKADKTIVLKSVKKISMYSQHLSATIDDFRDFFKSNKEQGESSYNSMINSVLAIVQASIESKNISLIFELSSQRMFTTYPNELKQGILNLIKNAEDALLEKEIKNAYIKITTYSDRDQEVLEISDNAGGVPKDIIDNIFDPYFSTKLEKNGTGLGLYMCKTIVEDHCAGKLSVKNDENGAVFQVTLNV